jgi:predicted regulator of Ras-like GTPase activity (Roadblock/LC7/MglB family)
VASIEESLRTLRDVQGVFGSFVISTSGSVVSKDLPAVFDNELLAEVGPRITRFYETFASGGEELDSVMLRYFEHKLYLRKLAWGFVGILSSIEVNLPALRMVGNLVARKIDPEVAAVTVSRPPTPRTPSPPQVSSASTRPPSVAPTPPPPPATRTAPPAPPRPTPSPPEARDSQQPTSEHQVRMYRGRRIDE